MRDERGSGAVLGVGILVLVAAIVLAALPLGRILAARQTTIGAADAAALAAADIASGRVPGVPCEAAAAIAGRLGAALEECILEGGVARVVVSAAIEGLPLRASARAGPPAASARVGPPAEAPAHRARGAAQPNTAST
ncbi:hypothetical protein B5808_13205 [Cnuibacter physcomitrellae]|uniref:Uncharacterized protein n=1 Tax=Cnuibacter physcomitrellae TaxID=1619308 RepID=A0A1X9LZ94_9MICO|nr:hypothetical protein B5808_13205 [Cnuibacter physcomitrellae]